MTYTEDFKCILAKQDNVVNANLFILRNSNPKKIKVFPEEVSSVLLEKYFETLSVTTDESEFVVSVSPFGYVVDGHAVSQEYYEAIEEKTLFMMNDGTELVALEDLEELDGYSLMTYNLFFATMPEDHHSSRALTTIFINTDALESVTIQQTLYGNEDSRVNTGDVVFYPER